MFVVQLTFIHHVFTLFFFFKDVIFIVLSSFLWHHFLKPEKRNMFIATKYNHFLKSSPILTKSITGGILAACGDLIAQKSDLSKQDDPLATRKFLVFTMFGASWTGPINHYWLGFLARKFPDNSFKALGKKLLVQHLVWNPFFYLPYFFTFNGILLGLSFQELESWIRKDFIPMLLYCWIVWIPITAWIFSIPERFQSVVMSSISLLWNSFLAWHTNNSVK